MDNQEVTLNAFVKKFREQNEENNFSFESLKAIHTFLKKLEENGEIFEINEIDIGQEFTEYTFKAFIDEYATKEMIGDMFFDEIATYGRLSYSKKELAEMIVDYKLCYALITDNYIIISDYYEIVK